MDKVLLLMVFWSNESENNNIQYKRRRNLKYCWKKLKELNQYLKLNGVNSDAVLYSYSNIKDVDDYILIQDNTISGFNKSKRINKILNLIDTDILLLIDCDLFFDKKDFEKILTLIKDFEKGQTYTTDAAKLNEQDTKIVIKTDQIDQNFEWRFAFAGDKNNQPHCGSAVGQLGGAFFIDFNLFKNIGFYNEDFSEWGGEDGEAISRLFNYLKINDNINKISVIRDFYPYHLNHDL